MLLQYWSWTVTVINVSSEATHWLPQLPSKLCTAIVLWKQCVHRKYFTYEWTVFKFRPIFDHILLVCHYIQTHILCVCVYIAQIIFAMVAVATNESLINSPLLWCLFINIAATTLTCNAEQTSLHKRSHCIKNITWWVFDLSIYCVSLPCVLWNKTQITGWGYSYFIPTLTPGKLQSFDLLL